ncbi:hypothetical protein HH310_14905 [Actinoplanes sp. TBRC 11911]|uniref:hypothetical protein n=1 Tax=Actinoplanes sp. TBRC 11911 TaxID=2729386 RepID=UPI00145D961E|nr:hypothetical protein [Actinoplanes sp. TBRC 11911]NMO52477.1 hypothetical protein [Actinoplanes sp. TBRC 11911]
MTDRTEAHFNQMSVGVHAAAKNLSKKDRELLLLTWQSGARKLLNYESPESTEYGSPDDLPSWRVGPMLPPKPKPHVPPGDGEPYEPR